MSLYCEACKAFTTRYYLAVYRGVLVGIETDLEAAEALIRSFNFEKLLLWHHDMYRKRERARGATHRAEMFMHNVCEWFEGGYDKMAPEDRRSPLFIWNRDILEKSEPLWPRSITSWQNARPRPRPATITGK